MGHYLLSLGSSLTEANSYEEAESAIRSSTEQFRELVGQFGRKPHDVCMFAAALNQWSVQMEKRDDLESAMQYLQQAIASEEEALRSEPGNADHRKTLSEYQSRMVLLE
ncbi:MAG: hypothetical protein ABL921_24270 [Pirellula sp.]